MTGRKFKLGMGLVTVSIAALALFPATNANADYAPISSDVVGVGSDTLQQLGDFVADSDFLGDPGYNGLGNANKFISVDATADANTRLAYGAQGAGTSCAPGTGGTAGTGNATMQHADSPCTLNPTVVLRAGRSPQQRPNGSGAGYNLLVADTNASGTSKGTVDFSRASSPRGSNTLFDSVTVGTDPLAMLSATNTNAVALSATQLNAIYSCTDTTWGSVGATGAAATATIVPLIPQVGSGTRSSFLTAISNPTLGSCVINVEENDPEAISSSSSPMNAIEPMSGGRLDLFQGNLSTGTSNNAPSAGIPYFLDPSCPFAPSDTTTPAACAGATPNLVPAVKFWSTGSPTSGQLFDVSRSLYLYFRHADIQSTIAFQPGSTLNWVRTMLYNPCSGTGHTVGCVTVGGTTYGPGGQPYIATGGAQVTISAAGITPAYAYTPSGP